MLWGYSIQRSAQGKKGYRTPPPPNVSNNNHSLTHKRRPQLELAHRTDVHHQCGSFCLTPMRCPVKMMGVGHGLLERWRSSSCTSLQLQGPAPSILPPMVEGDNPLLEPKDGIATTPSLEKVGKSAPSLASNSKAPLPSISPPVEDPN